jgi:hypothetical protein
MKDRFSLKDRITLLLSILAPLLSVAASINSELKGNAEHKRTVRGQLTDILSRLISINLENAKVMRDIGQTGSLYAQQVSSILSQQNAFLLDQAMYLSTQIPTLVTTVELNTIATANANAGNLIVAEQFYRRAIDSAPSDNFLALATRSYAAFLFPQRRSEEGREQFRRSIALLKGGDNLVRLTNGVTYQMWGHHDKSGTSWFSLWLRRQRFGFTCH